MPAPGFSPVAGIKVVESPVCAKEILGNAAACFSPVAGIKVVERSKTKTGSLRRLPFQSRCRD